jgi:hypothetical protein
MYLLQSYHPIIQTMHKSGKIGQLMIISSSSLLSPFYRTNVTNLVIFILWS